MQLPWQKEEREKVPAYSPNDNRHPENLIRGAENI